ncbi:MAG: AsmA-like C-terminal region-containing protein [Vicingaceae bacterium]
MLKKILKVVGVIIVLLLASIIVLPMVFKGQIVEKVKAEINNTVNAQVDFGDFDLSLISSFPDFTFSIEKLKVIGIEEFEGIKLAEIGEINLVVDLMSVINGEFINIKVVEILSPKFNVIVNKEGKANYDIAKESAEDVEVEEAEVVTEEGSSFRMELQRLEIADAQIIYDDREGSMYAEIKDMEFILGGDFSAEITDIEAAMSIAALTYKMDGISYLNKAEIEIEAELEADLAQSKYTFTKNRFRVNQLNLGLDGFVQLGENDDMDMDLTFNTIETSFKSILSMVPAVYSKDFESIETNGQVALKGFAKGQMEGENYPAFGLDLSVKDAYFKYPDLPKSVDNIQIAVAVNSPGGDLNNTVVDVSQFHVELAGNPFDMSVLIKTPMTDPFLKAGFKGKLDLGSIKDVIPLEEGDAVSGMIDMDVYMEGNQSTIDQERYEDFEAKGNLIITGMDYTSSTLAYAVNIKKVDVEFAPKYITLNDLDMMVGKSDFRAKGRVEKFIPYVFDDEAVLMASLTLSSSLIDATEFMEDEVVEEGAVTEGVETAEEPLEVVEIPGNLDVEFSSNIKKIHLDGYDIDNFSGKVVIRSQKMTLANTSMKLLDGTILTSGSYETTNPKNPSFDFNLDMRQFDIKKTVTTFNTVEKMVPLLKKSEGSYSAKFNVKGVFDDKMEVVGESLYGGGVLKTHQMGLKGFAPLEMLADKLKKENLRNPRLDNMNIAFTLEAGKMYMDPFDVKTGNILTTISGWSAFDQSIDYTMNSAIPSDEFGGAANKAAAGVLSMLQQKTGQQVNLPEIVNVRSRVTGTMDDPKIALELPGFGAGDAKEDLKKQLEEELAKKKKELEDKAKAEADRLKKEAEDRARAEADKAKDEAKKKIEEEKRKAEAEAKRKLEEEKRKAEEEAKRKAEEEAKKKLKGLFK